MPIVLFKTVAQIQGSAETLGGGKVDQGFSAVQNFLPLPDHSTASQRFLTPPEHLPLKGMFYKVERGITDYLLQSFA